jgi:hypothetical protein
VSILSPAADFVYGNTRLRARKADLLGPEDYDGLLGRDLPGIVEALSATAYSREIEAMLAGSNDLGRLHKALSANLGRVLDELRRFYQGPARTLVDLLLERYDLHNLIVLLRGRLRGHEPEQVVTDLVPPARSPASRIRPQRSTCSSAGACPTRPPPARSPARGPSTSAPRAWRRSSSPSPFIARTWLSGSSPRPASRPGRCAS